MGWEYNSHIVCMCIIMRWSRNHSATWAERFRTSSLLCTYKLCDYYTPIPILSPFLFTPSLYAPILNLQDFSFTCVQKVFIRSSSSGWLGGGWGREPLIWCLIPTLNSPSSPTIPHYICCRRHCWLCVTCQDPWSIMLI